MSDLPPPSLSSSARLLAAITRASSRHHLVVLSIAMVVAIVCWGYASQLQVQGSFVALLPTDSPTAHRFNEAMARRSGGSATLIVLAKSPDEVKNRRFVDRLAEKLHQLPQSEIEAIETGPGPAREFFQKWQWLFASRRDLLIFKCKLEQEKDKHRLGYLGLDEPCETSIAGPVDAEEEDLLAVTEPARKKHEGKLATPPGEGPLHTKKESALQKFDREMETRLLALDRYPTGYFQNKSGTLFSIMIRASSDGMGEFSSDRLFAHVKESVNSLSPGADNIQVGYAGDIPNAIEQRDALVSDMATISLIAVGLILGSIVLFFRSFVSLFQIASCVVVGCAVAFATAMAIYGRLNSATSFLGAIIAGNGINYGIIYLARYRELRSGGLASSEALVLAAQSSRKATWLAAVAAGGAYGALLLTSFRGFSEFGLIGGVGMLACWLATFLLLPAQITLAERLRGAGDKNSRPTLHLPLGFLSTLADRHGRSVLLVSGLLTVAAILPLKRYLADPWEYNFSRLGSSKSKTQGAGDWSKTANRVYKSRGSPMLLLADNMDEVLLLKKQLREQDQRITGGKYIERVETVYDRLGGPPDIIRQKLVLLAEIRDEIQTVLPRLKGSDREIAERWKPPAYLRALTPSDLPDLVRAQFTEKDGSVGTPIYVYLNRGLSQSDGHNLLKIAEIFESIKRRSGEIAPNASRSTVFAAMIRAMERDGPLATLFAFVTVVLVTILVTRRAATAIAILGSLLCGVLLTVGGAAWLGVRLNFLNFVALPLTFGIGVEYAINLYERIRSSGSVASGLSSIGGPVALCSVTTILGYTSLTMADNMALQSFGRYAIAGEVACILTALFVLPAALARMRPDVR